MNDNDIPNLDKMQRAFREALGLDDDYDVAELEYQGIREWDSVAHMQLIDELEEEFDVMLPTDDVIDMSSFKVAREILTRHGVDMDA